MSEIKRPALFLDRDGVINIDYGYVYKKDDFIFNEGIFNLVEKANSFGYKVIVVTNQAGIGRGYYSEKQFNALTDWMMLEFKKNNAHIDAVYHCSCHPVHGIGEYKRSSYLRKPNPGMLLQASNDFNLILRNSILVGDKLSDVEAGIRAGLSMCYLYNCSEMHPRAKNVCTFEAIQI
jgi:D-glycero-D-manno-heptose 1,7-bisphosphate phosphatase